MRNRRPSRLPVRVAWIIAVLLLAAGCGSASDERSPRLSKRTYIERSNVLQTDAESVLASMDGTVATTPAQAQRYLAALDDLIAGMEALDPPREWRDEHERILQSTRTMRQSMLIVSRASSRNTKLIRLQLRRSMRAQQQLEQAVRDINATR